MSRVWLWALTAAAVAAVAPACGNSDPADDDGVAGGLSGAGGAAGEAGAGEGGSSEGGGPDAGGASGGNDAAGMDAGGAGGAGEAGSGGPSEAGSPSEAGAGGSGEAGAGAGGQGEAGSAGASGEGGAGGVGSSDPWAGCPTAADYPGQETFPHTLEVSDEAVYCATFTDTGTLQEELQRKAQLRVAPGSYRLPAAPRNGLALPVCVAFGEGATPLGAVPQATTYQAQTFEGAVTHHYTFEERVPENRRLGIELYLTQPVGQSPGFLLDGDWLDPNGDEGAALSVTLCPEGDSCFPVQSFDSCTHASSTLNRHEVVLDSGSVTLDLRLGDSFAGTEPGAFVRASGTFRGVAFEQGDYYKLVYSPTHHHFERDFAVLFDEPIDGVCGIEITGLEPIDQEVVDEAYAVDCGLERLEPLTVTSHTLQR